MFAFCSPSPHKARAGAHITNQGCVGEAVNRIGSTKLTPCEITLPDPGPAVTHRYRLRHTRRPDIGLCEREHASRFPTAVPEQQLVSGRSQSSEITLTSSTKGKVQRLEFHLKKKRKKERIALHRYIPHSKAFGKSGQHSGFG